MVYCIFVNELYVHSIGFYMETPWCSESYWLFHVFHSGIPDFHHPTSSFLFPVIGNVTNEHINSAMLVNFWISPWIRKIHQILLDSQPMHRIWPGKTHGVHGCSPIGAATSREFIGAGSTKGKLTVLHLQIREKVLSEEHTVLLCAVHQMRAIW